MNIKRKDSAQSVTKNAGKTKDPSIKASAVQSKSKDNGGYKNLTFKGKAIASSKP